MRRKSPLKQIFSSQNFSINFRSQSLMKTCVIKVLRISNWSSLGQVDDFCNSSHSRKAGNNSCHTLFKVEKNTKLDAHTKSLSSNRKSSQVDLFHFIRCGHEIRQRARCFFFFSSCTKLILNNCISKFQSGPLKTRRVSSQGSIFFTRVSSWGSISITRVSSWGSIIITRSLINYLYSDGPNHPGTLIIFVTQLLPVASRTSHFLKESVKLD